MSVAEETIKEQRGLLEKETGSEAEATQMPRGRASCSLQVSISTKSGGAGVSQSGEGREERMLKPFSEYKASQLLLQLCCKAEGVWVELGEVGNESRLQEIFSKEIYVQT